MLPEHIVQIVLAFMTVNIIIPSIIMPLVTSYSLDIWNAFHYEVDKVKEEARGSAYNQLIKMAADTRRYIRIFQRWIVVVIMVMFILGLGSIILVALVLGAELLQVSLNQTLSFLYRALLTQAGGIVVVGILFRWCRPSYHINELREERSRIKSIKKKITMKKKIVWNATRLSAAGALGVLLFVINLMTGTLVVLAGIPGGGQLVAAFFFPMIIMLTCFIIPIFPSIFIMAMVYSLLSLSVPILGPPGFLPKVLVVALTALSADTVAHFFRQKEKLASVVVPITAGIVILLLLAITFKLFLPPDISSPFLSALLMSLGGTVVIAPVGGIIGWAIFNRVRRRAVVIRLRGE